MFIPRLYQLADYLKPGKVLIIFGPRQAGKTTLVNHYLHRNPYQYRFETGDNIQIQDILSVPDLPKLKEFVAGYELLVIDEAQKIKNIGEVLKLLIDQIPQLRIIATGSSSFELAGQIGEPLTGRKITLNLFPIAQFELIRIYNKHDLRQQLENYLIYGSYPEIVVAEQVEQKRELITEIMQSYLLKDILSLEKIKNSKILLDLIRLLAFQIGKEVSLSELAMQIGIDGKTVARYLDLLEKSFVIYNLRGYSRNLRKEITKKSKYYFYDNGIRNAIIANFNSLNLRNDIGELWENFIVIERIKKQIYQHMHVNNYFWRTWDQQEVDFVEERAGQLFGYEIKWKMPRQLKKPKDWLTTYENAQFNIIHNENYLEFIA
ncbi:MAG: hypothetical protein A3F42_08485 [Gammaproteobacteria bacterium RIFCSPHIGHO2_12_FULL_37_34]|nr:MAG: hypothetical protein A3F42_08485 [Gammaproteobacteria bacterium RIFCSPHIGHO2_12_FULL_37_34]